MTTHYAGCWDSGPRHYECALLEVKRLRGESEANIGSLGMPVNVAVSPRREWVGLTDDEKYDCYLKIDVWSRCVEAVEAKLKAKNGG